MNLASPSPTSAQNIDDFDPADLTAPLIVKIAGGASMVTGAFTLGLAAQTGLMFRMRDFVPIVLGAMVVLGIVTLIAGFGGLRAKASSTIAGAVGSGFIALCGSIWAVLALSWGLVSPLSFGVVLFAIPTAILGGIAIGPSRKVSVARAALRAKGLDFGV